MSKSFVMLFCLLAGLLFLGCSKSETTTNRESTTAPTTASPAASPAATIAPTSSAAKIGVPECDAFLTTYETCVNDKVPAAARAQFNTSLAQWRKNWHDLAANPQTKATLASACKTQLEAARTSMKTYGCTF